MSFITNEIKGGTPNTTSGLKEELSQEDKKTQEAVVHPLNSTHIKFTTEFSQGWTQASTAQMYAKSCEHMQKPCGEQFFAIFRQYLPQLIQSVVDLGCGTGQLSDYMARELPLAEKIKGVDISKPMLDYARETYTSDRVSFFHLENVEFDLQGLNTKFDVAFSCCVFHMVENPTQALKNLKGALSDNARVGITYIAGASQEDPFFQAVGITQSDWNNTHAKKVIMAQQRSEMLDLARACKIVEDAGYTILYRAQRVQEHLIPTQEEAAEWFLSTMEGNYNGSLTIDFAQEVIENRIRLNPQLLTKEGAVCFKPVYFDLIFEPKK